MIGRPLVEPRTGAPGFGVLGGVLIASRFGNESDKLAVEIEAMWIGV
jgi:hypothetical protein